MQEQATRRKPSPAIHRPNVKYLLSVSYKHALRCISVASSIVMKSEKILLHGVGFTWFRHILYYMYLAKFSYLIAALIYRVNVL